MFSFVARIRPPPTPIPKSYSVKSSTYLHTTPLPELPQSTRPHSISAKTKGQVACQPPSHPSKAWSVDKWTGICASGLGIYFLILPSNPSHPKKKESFISARVILTMNAREVRRSTWANIQMYKRMLGARFSLRILTFLWANKPINQIRI